jgi:hypothetical protein
MGKVELKAINVTIEPIALHESQSEKRLQYSGEEAVNRQNIRSR